MRENFDYIHDFSAKQQPEANDNVEIPQGDEVLPCCADVKDDVLSVDVSTV